MSKLLRFPRSCLVLISLLPGCAGDDGTQSQSLSDASAMPTDMGGPGAVMSTAPASTNSPASGTGSGPALGSPNGPSASAPGPGGGGPTPNGQAGGGATPPGEPVGETPNGPGNGGMAGGGSSGVGGRTTGNAGNGAMPAAGTGGTATEGGEAGASAGGSETGGAPSGTAGAGGNTTPMQSSGCGVAAGLVNGRTSIDVNGAMREYILRLPDDYDPNHPYRLIFGWHQLSGSAESIANRGFYGLEGPSEGQAILVAPEGLVGNDRGDKGWWNNGGEDMDFYFAMLDLFTSELCVDEERIFSTGFSFGAMFSFSLACTEGSMMRAIAPQAGSARGGCGNGAGPVAALGFVGVNDSLLDGHRQGMDGLGDRDGCSGEPVAMSVSWCDGLGDNNKPCTCVEYQNCDAAYPVIACEYEAGHTFAPNSGDTIWEFFSQF